MPTGWKEMRTIEEVIGFMEERQKTEDWDVRRDALEYLKSYKEMVDGIVSVIVKYKDTILAIIDEAEKYDKR